MNIYFLLKKGKKFNQFFLSFINWCINKKKKHAAKLLIYVNINIHRIYLLASELACFIVKYNYCCFLNNLTNKQQQHPNLNANFFNFMFGAIIKFKIFSVVKKNFVVD